MRSFLAGLLLLVAFVTGTAALGAVVANHTVLNRDEAGRLVDYALTHPGVRDRILTDAVPEYDALPSAAKSSIGALAGSSPVRHAAQQLTFTDDGRVSLGALQDELAGQLKDHGLGSIGDRVASAGAATFELPGSYSRVYATTNQRSDQVTVYGTAATIVLVVLALLVSPRRFRTLGAAGLAAVLSCGVVALAYYLLPSLIRLVSSDELIDAASGALNDQWPTVWTILVPVAVVGAVLALVGLVVGRRAS